MNFLEKVLNGVSRNSQTILTATAVTGVFVTAVLGTKATIKAVRLVDHLELEEPKDIINATYKYYIPTAIMGVLTVSCIIGINAVAVRKNAALLGAYKLGEKVFDEYKMQVRETLGKEKEKEIRDNVNEKRIIQNPVSTNEVIVTGKGDTLCYDALSGRYFKSNIEKIRQVMNKLSRDMMSEQTISLNQVYLHLDLEETKLGDDMGWRIDDGLIEPEFSSHITDSGEPCLVLDYYEQPKYRPWD